MISELEGCFETQIRIFVLWLIIDVLWQTLWILQPMSYITHWFLTMLVSPSNVSGTWISWSLQHMPFESPASESDQKTALPNRVRLAKLWRHNRQSSMFRTFNFHTGRHRGVSSFQTTGISVSREHTSSSRSTADCGLCYISLIFVPPIRLETDNKGLHPVRVTSLF